jgi:hypothetical protein
VDGFGNRQGCNRSKFDNRTCVGVLVMNSRIELQKYYEGHGKNIY